MDRVGRKLYYCCCLVLMLSSLSTVGQTRLPAADFNKFSVEFQTGFDFPLQPWHIIRDVNDKPILDDQGREQKVSLRDYKGYGGQIGIRYMFNSTFGIRPHYDFHHFYTTVAGMGTFLRFHRFGIEGVVSIADLFEARRFYETRRWNGLIHVGGGFTRGLPSKLYKDPKVTGWKHEDIWSGMIGFTPQYRVNRQISVFADASLHLSAKQHYGYHGRYLHPGTSTSETGVFISTSLGIQWSLGSKAQHIDWR